MQSQSEEEDIEREKNKQEWVSLTLWVQILSQSLVSWVTWIHSLYAPSVALCPSLPRLMRYRCSACYRDKRAGQSSEHSHILQHQLLLWSTRSKLQSSSQSPVARSSDASVPQLPHGDFCGLCCTQREPGSEQMDEVRNPP